MSNTPNDKSNEYKRIIDSMTMAEIDAIIALGDKLKEYEMRGMVSKVEKATEGHGRVRPRLIKDKQGTLVGLGDKVAYASTNDGLVFAEVVAIDEEFPGHLHMTIKTYRGKGYSFISERGDFLKLVLK